MALSLYTKLNVANQALAMLGESPVASIADTAGSDTKIRALGRAWPFALDELLRAFPWNWAKTRAILDQASPSPSFEWSHAFTLPTDYVTLLTLNETCIGKAGDWWEIESGLLLTDEGEAKVEYIYTPTETATDAFIDRMDPLARAALVTLLASKVAPYVTKDGGASSTDLYQRYLRVDLATARTRNAGETKTPWSAVRTDSAWNASRYAGTNG